jgi:hypothetical protein
MHFDAKPFDAMPRADRPAWLDFPTVRVLPAVDVAGLPKLFSNEEARVFLRIGINKWGRIKREIDCIEITGRQLYTLDALLTFTKRKTRLAEPQRKAGARPASPPAPKPAAAGNEVTPLRRPKRGESRATT